MHARDAATPPSGMPSTALISDEFLALLRDHGVVEATVFGSVARGTVTPESDIDMLVTFDHPVPLNVLPSAPDSLSPDEYHTGGVMTPLVALGGGWGGSLMHPTVR